MDKNLHTSVSKKSPRELQNDELEAPKKDTYLQKKGNKLLMKFVRQCIKSTI